MKTIKKKIEVPACEICNKEISSGVRSVQVIEKGGQAVREHKDDKGTIQRRYYNKEDTVYLFHQECVNKLLIETAKKLNN